MAQIKPSNLGKTFFGLFAISVILFISNQIYVHLYKRENILMGDFAQQTRSKYMDPQTFLGLGASSEKDFRINDAASFYKQGTQFFPDNADLWLGLGRTKEKLGLNKEALAAYIQASALLPDRASLYDKIARVNYDLSLFPAALHAIQKAVRLDPSNPNYLLLEAQLANLTKQYGRAAKTYEELLILEKPRQENELLWALDKTLAWSKESPPKEYAPLFLQKAETLFNRGNLVDAHRVLDDYFFLFGMTQDYQDLVAVQIYKESIKHNPKDSESRYKLAQYYEKKGQPVQGFEEMEAALQINPQNLDYLFLYSVLANEVDQQKKVMEAYKSILALVPNMPHLRAEIAYFNLSEVTTITPQQLRSSPLLTEVSLLIDASRFKEAFEKLQEYREKEHENAIYQEFILFFASQLNPCCLREIGEQSQVETLAKDFVKLSDQKQGSAALLQSRATLIAKQGTDCDPCSIDALAFYIKTLRVLEGGEPIDFIKLLCLYKKMISLDPWNRIAWLNLARLTAYIQLVDQAACLYRQYLDFFPAEKEILIEYALLLEAQGNIGLALRYLDLYCLFFGVDTPYWEARAHVLNSGNYATQALIISQRLIAENPQSYNAWLDFTTASALLNYPFQALYGLTKLYCLSPGNPETEDTRRLVLPPILPYWLASGEFYQETTTLTQYKEALEGGYPVCPGLIYEAGGQLFQTSSTALFNTVLGLGSLRGINGEIWGTEEGAWAGLYQLVTPKLGIDCRLGGQRLQIGHTHSVTPTYRFNALYRANDCLSVDFNSTYGFYLISPRALSLRIRQWRNVLTTDWRPCWGYQLLTIFDGRVQTDGCKQLMVWVHPRKTFFYLEHWKIDAGFWGNWFTSSRFRQTGYYQPYFYEGYGGEVLIDYLFDYYNIVVFRATLGTQKDNFSTRFGFLGDFQCEGKFNVSLRCYIYLSAEYYYIDTSEGRFSFIDFAGKFLYRF